MSVAGAGVSLPEIQSNRAARAISGFSGFVPGQQDALGISQVQVLKSAAHKRVVPVMYPRTVAGSFLSPVSTDGAIYDHGFETTSRQASREVEQLAASRGRSPLPGAGEPVRATTGYGGHIHQHLDVIGKSFHHSLALGDKRLEAAASAHETSAPEECEPHWTEFYSKRNDASVVDAGGWRSMYGLYLARRASPDALAAAASKAVATNAAAGTVSAGFGLEGIPGPKPLDQYDRALLQTASRVGFGGPAATADAPRAAPSSARGAVAPETLWLSPPPPAVGGAAGDSDVGGPLSTYKARGVSGYTGHVPHAIDTLARTYTRVAAALESAQGNFAAQEPPHPLGKSSV